MLQDIASIATILGVLGLGVAYVAWRQSQAAFHQAVIVSCTTRFQKLSPKLQANVISGKTVQKYLELCNEELFYFEQNYLPQGIIDEWVEGMVSNIGLWYQPAPPQPAQLLCPPPANDGDRQHAAVLFAQAAGYPRLCQAFTISAAAKHRIEHAVLHEPEHRTDQAKHDAMRARMVLEVLTNLRQYQQQPFYTYLNRHRYEA